MEIEYWQWLILGMLLMALEMALPSFVLLWFGAGAIVSGIVLLVVPISLTAQVLIWALASIAFTLLWFKYLKPLSIDKTMAGLPNESILGETGLVIKAPAEQQRGIVRFTTPKLGSEEWPIISEQSIALGDRVRVTGVSGNALLVVPA